jgi:hypothetical protein
MCCQGKPLGRRANSLGSNSAALILRRTKQHYSRMAIVLQPKRHGEPLSGALNEQNPLEHLGSYAKIIVQKKCGVGVAQNHSYNKIFSISTSNRYNSVNNLFQFARHPPVHIYLFGCHGPDMLRS